MQNFKLYTKSEVMKMALEIEGEMIDVILNSDNEIDERTKLLYTVNRFKSAIYERLGLSLEEFNKICDDVITEREKAKQ